MYRTGLTRLDRFFLEWNVLYSYNCLLFSKDSYIVDNGRAGIWVWIGKRSSPKERQEAMRNALVGFHFD